MAVIAPPDHTVFFKFLPNCEITSVIPILDQFISIVREYGGIFNHISPNRLNLIDISEHDLITQRYFHVISWRGSHPLIKEGGEITLVLTQIPHLTMGFNPPLKERNKCEELRQNVLEKGFVDIVNIYEPDIRTNRIEEIKIFGQNYWVYLYNKIKKLELLRHQMFNQTKSLDSLSTVYQFAKQSEKIFSSIELYTQLALPYSKRTLPEDQLIRYNTNIKNFIQKYDHKLLTAWGGKQFRANLYPLRVSLDDWLKAV
jgi:hypothetical protein